LRGALGFSVLVTFEIGFFVFCLGCFSVLSDFSSDFSVLVEILAGFWGFFQASMSPTHFIHLVLVPSDKITRLVGEQPIRDRSSCDEV